MKTITCILFLSTLPTLLLAQPGMTSDVQFALQRIEHGFRSGAPDQFEDLIESGMVIRLGDKLYEDVSSIEALKTLKAFFANKTSLKFSFDSPFLGTGTLRYSENGENKSTPVDVWISRSRTGLRIWALNISDYPTSTMFLTKASQQ